MPHVAPAAHREANLVGPEAGTMKLGYCLLCSFA
jgi:hypothetical protein